MIGFAKILFNFFIPNKKFSNFFIPNENFVFIWDIKKEL